MDQGPATALDFAPDRAVRGRLIAILVDGFLVTGASRFLVPALGAHTFGAVLVALVVIQFLYFFFQEATRGQTIGKRAAHVRVIQVDGTPPTLKQLAIRNALRVFDALPMFYASGLVSVMWTGPGRRQRMGDRVAGTAVILEPGGKSMSTPGWLLPTLTVAAVLLSVVVWGAAYDKYRTPNVDANALTPVPVPGFEGDNSQAPAIGIYDARAILNGAPAFDPVTGKPMTRSWSIDKRCATPQSCTYEISRTVPDLGKEAGLLVAAADGWHVDFPTHAFKARCPGDGGLTTVMRRASFVLHFDPGGGSAEAHERTLFRSDRCGEFTSQLDWSAALARF